MVSIGESPVFAVSFVSCWIWTLSTKFWTKGDVGDVSIESLSELPTEVAAVSMDSLRRESAAVLDVCVKGSEIMEPWRDTESLSASLAALICKNSGYWLQTAKNVSLEVFHRLVHSHVGGEIYKRVG